MDQPHHLDPHTTMDMPARAGYEDPGRPVASETPRRWWDAAAEAYLHDHGEALGESDFVWGPEGLREADAHLLGNLDGARVLEVGAGAKQCSRWLTTSGIDVVATDISGAMLARGADLDHRTGIAVPAVQADARSLPFAAHTFDVVFTSYGVLPFVPEATTVHREVARVLRPGGRWVFSISHPVRWAFPDVPGEEGLTACRGYFDTTPYVEVDDAGEVVYAEYHRPLAQLVAEVVAAGFHITELTEPTWQGDRPPWGGWSRLRAQYLPGTVILSCRSVPPER